MKADDVRAMTLDQLAVALVGVFSWQLPPQGGDARLFDWTQSSMHPLAAAQPDQNRKYQVHDEKRER